MGSEVPSFEDIPKLTKSNYRDWKVMIEKHLRREGLWGYVDNTVCGPSHKDPKFLLDANTGSEYQDWAVKHATARSILRRKCDAWALPYVEGKRKASGIWRQLEMMYKNVAESPVKKTGKSTNYTWWPPLYSAIVKSELETVQQLVLEDREVLTVSLTSKGEIPIHVAAQHGHDKIVEKMIEMMPVDKLKKQGKYGRSALHIAASEGNIAIVKALVGKRNDLVMVPSVYYDNNIPITVAARAGMRNKDVVHYLYPITLDRLKQAPVDAKWNKIRAGFLVSLIYGEFFGRALKLLQEFPDWVSFEDENKVTALAALSTMPSAFESSFLPAKTGGFWLILGSHLERVIYSFIDVDVHDEDIIPCLHTRRDVENSSNASSDNSEGGDGITNCKISWFHALFQRALKLVPRYETIYNKKLKHQSALKLLNEIWKLISEVDDLGLKVGDDIWTTMEDEAVKAMFGATELGISEFIKAIICNCPQLLSQSYWQPNYTETENQDSNADLTVFHYAIRHRQEKIFELISEEKIAPLKNEIMMLADRSTNFMSHLAAEIAPTGCLNKIPGPALQVQDELRWLKKVERIMPPSCQEFKNKQGKTARVLFTEKHANLLKDGATWMKDTATQCMVVATLITTIMFAAMFTVPGAKESDTGEPRYVHGKFPIAFLAANILSLCSSVASMLMFLAIITSRYSEEDFLQKLPQKLIRGLLFLFLSIVGMMIEFSVAVLFLIRYNILWISFPIVFLASVPITIYALAEFPLFMELTISTIGKEEFAKGKRSGPHKNLKHLFLRGATS